MSGSQLITAPDVPADFLEELEKLSGEKKFKYMRYMAETTLSDLETLKAKVKDVKGFWPFTLIQHTSLANLVSSKPDKEALTYLTDVGLEIDPKDPREYTIKFYFRENPYFSNEVLEKKYTLAEGSKPAPEDGSITADMQDFDITDLQPQSIKIDWKSPEMDLCAKHPRDADADEDFDGDSGSFFWYFTSPSDPFAIGAILQQDILPEAIEYFLGRGENAEGGDDEFDEDDELDEEEDYDEGSIDLEDDEPQKKRTKTE